VDRDHVPAVLLQRRDHAGSGVERDLALGREPAHHDGDTAAGELVRCVHDSSWDSSGAPAPCAFSPMILTSSSSATPWTRATSLRTRSISTRSCAAVAAPVLTSQLAWTGEQSASPSRHPLHPATSISRPA